MKELSNCSMTNTDEEYGFFCIIDYDYTEPQKIKQNKNIENKLFKIFNKNNKKTSNHLNIIIDNFNGDYNNNNNSGNKIIKKIYLCAILITMAFSVYHICCY